MKYLIMFVFFILVGCGISEHDKKLLESMTPLTAQEQSEAIKACETNPNWTGKPVTYKGICLQIRCVQK